MGILGQAPSATYYYCVKSASEPGYWPAEECGFNFLTPKRILYANLAVSDVMACTARVHWDTYGSQNPSTPIPSTSQVEYAPTATWSNPGARILVPVPEDPNLVTSHSVDLSGLTPDTEYTYRVWSNNTALNYVGVPSDTHTFTTVKRDLLTISASLNRIYVGNTATVTANVFDPVNNVNVVGQRVDISISAGSLLSIGPNGEITNLRAGHAYTGADGNISAEIRGDEPSSIEVVATMDRGGCVPSVSRTISVVPIAGNILVEDSIQPTDDRHMPFGRSPLGLSRTEHITVHNNDPVYGLIVSRILLTGCPCGPAQQPAAMGIPAKSPAPYENHGSAFSTHSQEQNPAVLLKRAHHPDTLLVGFKPGVQAANYTSIHSAIGATRSHSYRRIRTDVVKVPKGGDLERYMAAYRARPDVAYVEPNYELKVLATPNDPHFSDLWGLHNTGQTGGTAGADISAVEAWNTTTGGNCVVVGVIDTGIDYNHMDLAANVWVNPNPTFGDVHGARWTNGNGSITSGDPMDDHGHGTHSSGTIGAIGNNALGVAGINWNVKIMGLKFLSAQGGGWLADAVSALEYAIDHGANLTSNSWGGGGYSQSLYDTIASAGAANQLFIAAAGNASSNNDSSPAYPASYDCDNIISVAASDNNDQPAYFTNYGLTTVDLAAPGVDIVSLRANGTDMYGDGAHIVDTYYYRASGTSMATPHVSGVAALALSLNPNAAYQDVKRSILEGVDVLPAWSGKTVTGGRLTAVTTLGLASPFRLDDVPTLPTTVPPGGSLTFDVTYAPTSEGNHEGVVRIESNDQDEPVVCVTLDGSTGGDVVQATIQQGKRFPNGAAVRIDGAIVSATWGGYFYIEADNRSCGIPVNKNGHGMAKDVRANVVGTVQTNADGERYIQASTVTQAGVGSVAPLGMANQSVGGADLFHDPVTGAGQQGVVAPFGPNNIGLLVRTWGTITRIGQGYFYIDDGSVLDDQTLTGGQKNIGVRVVCNPSGYNIGDHAVISGVSSCFRTPEGLARRILTRSAVVSNVSARQRTDGSFIVDVLYDVQDPDSATVNVSLAVSDNGGATYAITPTAVSGDIGRVHTGSQRHIIWDAGVDIPNRQGNSFVVSVTAEGARSAFSAAFSVDTVDGNEQSPYPAIASVHLDSPHGSAPYDYRGQLHCHSISDLPPGDPCAPNPWSKWRISSVEMADAYLNAGFDFLAETSHDVLSGDITSDSYFMLPPPYWLPFSDELTMGSPPECNGPHILAIGCTGTNATHDSLVADSFWPNKVYNVRQRIRNVHQFEGLAFIAHPDQWPYNITVDEMTAVHNSLVPIGQSIDGVAIFNSARIPVFRKWGKDFIATWDKILGNGIRIWGFAEEDWHPYMPPGIHEMGTAWVSLPIELYWPFDPWSYEQIIRTLRRGNYYAMWSLGLPFTGRSIPTLRVSVTDGNPAVVHAEVLKPDMTLANEVQFKFVTGARVQFKSDHPATYTCLGDETYVRIMARGIETAEDLVIASQPIWVWRSSEAPGVNGLEAKITDASSDLIVRYPDPSTVPASVPPAGRIGPVVEVTTETGEVPPDASLKLYYDPRQVDDLGGSQYLALYWYAGTSMDWVKVGGTVNLEEASIESPISVLGLYVISADCPPDATVPQVFIDNPPTGGLVSGPTLLKASVNDNLGAWRVSFYADDVLIYEDADGWDGWTAQWEPAADADGDCVLKVEAEDLAGNRGVAEIPVHVHGQP